MNALFDSGAQISLANPRVVKAMGFKPVALKESRKVRSFTGEEIDADQIVLLNINLGIGAQRKHIFFVTTRMTNFDLILGMDFLSRFQGYGVDFENGIIYVKEGDNKVPLVEPTDDPLLLEVRKKIWDIENRADSFNQYDCFINHQPGSGTDPTHVFDMLNVTVRIPNETDADPEDKEFMDQMRTKYPDVFAPELPPKPVEREVTHAIPLKPNTTPHWQQYYRVNPAHRAELEKQLDYLLHFGLIRKTDGSNPFGAPVVLAPKADGTLRFCVDYRRLNNNTEQVHWSMPRIEDLLDRLKNAKVFSKMDLRNGYWQIPIHKDDVPKTAFITPQGQFEWTVLPMGITNAPATFMKYMDSLFNNKEYSGFVLVYLDDVLIFSNNKADHRVHVEAVLSKLNEEKLRIKDSKCEWFKALMGFLGHMVQNGTIKPQFKKLEAIKNFPRPKTVGSVRAFLGLTGYYRRFIPKYALRAAPIMSLLKGNPESRTTIEWGPEQEKAFVDLTEALAADTCLKIPEQGKPYRVTTDASNIALGGVLEQQVADDSWAPVAFFSRKLNDKGEQNYSTWELECLAVLECLREWEHLLVSNPVTVLTDHRALVYLRTADLKGRKGKGTGRLARWQVELDIIDKVNPTIEYIEGKSNVVADALSRFPPEVCAVSVELPDSEEPPLVMKDKRSRLGEVQPEVSAVDGEALEWSYPGPKTFFMSPITMKEDPGLEVWSVIPDKAWTLSDYSEEERKSYTSQPKLYRINPEETRFEKLSGKKKRWIPVVPKNGNWKRAIMELAHDSLLGGGHQGYDRTITKLKELCTWECMKKDVLQYVSTCETCALNKSPHTLPFGLLSPLPVPSRPFESVSMDLVMGLPLTNDLHDSIFVVVDRYSKYTVLMPCQESITAAECADLFEKRVACVFGWSKQIISDRDPRFTSEFFDHWKKQNQLSFNMSTARHPQTDGQTERMNRTAVEILRAFCQGDQAKTWDSRLHYVQFIMNSHASASTRKTPFEVLFGQEPHSPLSLRLGTEPTDSVGDEERAEIRRYVEEHLQKTQERMKAYANLRRVDRQFKVGDLIKLKTDGLNFKNVPPKFKQPFIGPFAVEKVMGPLTYRLTLPPTLKIHPVFHVSQFHDFHQRPLASDDDPDNPATITEEQARHQPVRPGPVVDNGDDEPEYEVEAIIGQDLIRGRRGDKNEDYLYYLKWTGWDEDKRAYTFDKLSNCDEVLQAWRDKNPLKTPKKPNKPKKASAVRKQPEQGAMAPTHVMTTRGKARAAGTSAT
jgi:hypothetical protein